MDGDLANGHVAATNSHNTPWWQVELGSVQNISSITVWGRTDCCPEMSSDFYVFVSDVPFWSYDFFNSMNQLGVSYYFHAGFSGPGSGSGLTSININRTGRFVRVYLPAFNSPSSLALAEVQVWSAAAKVEWLVTDHLGTPRMAVDKTGSLAGVSRHDYLPFGEDLSASTTLRSSAAGYNLADGVRQKLTSKERDTETGLDYFGARYNASTQGRFISVDPALTSADTATPQTWNRYSYGLNNPLTFNDPTGAFVWSAALGGSATDAELRKNAGTNKKDLKAAEQKIAKRDLFRQALSSAGEAGPRSDDPDAVARAVNSYGTEGQDNGVTVTFGALAKGVVAEAGPASSGGLSPTSLNAQVLVTISDSIKDLNSLAQAVAHEGWHVADRQGFANHLIQQSNAAGGLQNFSGSQAEANAFASPYNRLRQTTELGAYIVSGLVAQGRDAITGNFSNSSFGGHEVWNRNWSAAEGPRLRAVGAYEHITTSPTYAGKLNQRMFGP